MNENMYNLNIERAVLSAIIFDPQIFEEIASKLEPHDFYLPFHQYVFSAMEELTKEDKPIDEEFLKNKLTIAKKFDEVAMLNILVANPISNTDAYLGDIKSRSTKRALAGLATTIKKVTIEDNLAVEEVMNLVEKKLYQITQNSTSEDFRDSKEITLSMLDEIKRLKALDNSKLLGVDTGFKNLNDRTSGFGKGDLVIIAARPAMGKCLGRGTKVLMYSGELKKVEDIKVGDLLMGNDSTPRKVLSLASGREEMYWVRQNKGVDYRVNKSHILSLKRSRNEEKHKHGDILNISVEEYIKKSNRFKSNYKGYKVAIEFSEKKLDIEPYFLGLWLGDGSKISTLITTTDKEIVNYLEYYADKLKMNITYPINIKKHPDYRITNSSNVNVLFQMLKKLNLLNNKHIPQIYLSNSKKNRLELLAGLIDSDGYYDNKYHVIEITQKSKKLAKQIKFLADSLGFRCSLKSKIAKIKQIGYECEVYRVRIVGHLDIIPTKVARKQARPLVSKREHLHTGIKIEYDKIDDYYGFEIDGNKLFLLEDMTVTHNTSLVLNITQKALERDEGVAFFSLEMPAEQLMLRLLSTETSIPLQNLRVGNLNDEEWRRLVIATDKMERKKLFVDDGGYATIHQVRSKLRKLKGRHPEISMAIIDYLQLMSGDSPEGRQMVISEISRGLKQLARELQIPILALSQLNRGVESRDNKRPMLSDLRESGCLSGETVIVDANSGKKYRIDELVNDKDLLPMKTKAMDKNLKVKNFTITNAFYSGEKTVYKLRTKSGKTINATANHKFYKVEGWTRLDKLSIGDKIATPDKIDINPKKNALSNNELILLAHLLGDGSILERQAYHYTNEDMQNIEIVKYVVKELFNIDAKLVKQKNWWHLYLTSPYNLTHNRKHPITIWYEKLNIKRVRSYDKEIPQSVFECNESGIKLFLKHIWATDGSITIQHIKNKSDTIKVYYATTSYILATQIKSLLLRVGIVSTIRKVRQIKYNKEYRASYHVLIQGKINLQKFLINIGSFGKRGKNSDLYLKVLENIKSNPNNDCIDKVVWQTIIKKAKDKQNISWRLFSEKLGMSYCGSSLFKNSISKERMKKISNFLEDKNIKNLANSNIYWDEIVSIEKIDKVKTYDLTVDSVHNFVANDIIVHNSIEQDADIVMFVYRDDVYREAAEKEKEMKAKANGQEYENKFKKKEEEETELILGKHRNGPTGTVKLIFQKRFTRFVDEPREGEGSFETIYEDGNIDTSTQANINPLPTI